MRGMAIIIGTVAVFGLAATVGADPVWFIKGGDHPPQCPLTKGGPTALVLGLGTLRRDPARSRRMRNGGDGRISACGASRGTHLARGSHSVSPLSDRHRRTTIDSMGDTREKVVMAMSGGVDSSVAACLLVEQGYEVVGVFMRLGSDEGTEEKCEARSAKIEVRSRNVAFRTSHFELLTLEERGGNEATPATARQGQAPRQSDEGPAGHRGCCSAADAADARFVAGKLGIPFYALNFQSDFDSIIEYFADEYVRGRTPNPCIICNDQLKFGRLVEYADAVGARYVATGHYARIARRDGRSMLLRGRDEAKDQSYVLFGLSRTLLDRVLFPVGDLTKTEVRAVAARLGLPNCDKPDSVEICFAPDRDYARVVRERRPDGFVEGNVLDQSGRVIGRHGGIAQFTIGQRRGLGIAAGKPIYVTRLQPADNTVVMGNDDDLLRTALVAGRPSFLIDNPGQRFRATVKIRYLHKAAPATVEVLGADVSDLALLGPRRLTLDASRKGEQPAARASCHTARAEPRGSGSLQHASGPTLDASREGEHPAARGLSGQALGDGKVRVTFDEPQRAITPGQAVVFYDGDVVIGGAWIERAERALAVSGEAPSPAANSL